MHITAAIDNFLKGMHNKPTQTKKRTFKAKRAMLKNQNTVDEINAKKT